MVASVAATCGTASCGQYNAVFLEGLLSVLRSSPEWAAGAGFCRSPPLAQLAAFGRVYAGWGLPGEWYRAQLWRRHGGHASLEAFLRDSWEAWTVGADANDLVAMLRTWRAASVADAVAGAAPPAEGGVAPTPEAAAEAAAAALARVTARVVYLPGPGDRYFPLEEVEAEAAAVGGRKGAGADVVPLTHEWGHRAGDPHRPGQERDYDTIRAAVRRLLQGGS